MIEAEEAWRACMDEAGMPRGVSSSIAWPREVVSDRWFALAYSDAAADGSHQELDVDPAELAEFRRFEIEVAVAHLSCHVDYYNEVAVRDPARA